MGATLFLHSPGGCQRWWPRWLCFLFVCSFLGPFFFLFCLFCHFKFEAFLSCFLSHVSFYLFVFLSFCLFVYYAVLVKYGVLRSVPPCLLIVLASEHASHRAETSFRSGQKCQPTNGSFSAVGAPLSAPFLPRSVAIHACCSPRSPPVQKSLLGSPVSLKMHCDRPLKLLDATPQWTRPWRLGALHPGPAFASFGTWGENKEDHKEQK